ncbi:MAG: hypothetical protein WA952_20615, partial [Lewinella sp.]
MVAILDKFLNRISPAYHQRSLTAHFRPPTGVPGSQTGPRVLFIPFYTDPLFLARETFFAKALEWRGARTALLYADCHISPTERGELPAKLGFRHPVLAGGARLLDHLHQEGLPVSKFYRPTDRNSRQRELRELTPEDLESYHYRDIHLGDLAVSSSVRILMSMGPEWDNPTYRSLVLDLLCTGIELVDTFYRAYDDYRPDRIVMSHAIYLTWGVAFRVARQLDILTLVYNGSYRRDTLRMYVNVPNAPFPEAEWPRFRGVALTDVERRWAEKYLASRAHLEGEAHDLFGGEDFPADLSSFIQQSKAEGKRLATLFTNMSWDAYAFSGTGAFASMVDWANATLEFARSNPELRLIFKIHPAEAYWGVPEAYRIRNHLVDIPANVFLLT